MGKTAAGAVWLNDDALSDYEYWQFWRNVADADVLRFLKLFTDLSVDAIDALPFGSAADINAAKKLLATEATALCRGREAAERVAETARRTFEEGESDTNLPTAQGPLPIVEALLALGFAASKGEARRLIAGGGARIDGQKVSQTAVARPGMKVSAGKKLHGLITA